MTTKLRSLAAAALALTLALLATPIAAVAVPTPPSGRAAVYGVVTNEATEPLAGVTLRLGSLTTTTDAAGYYEFQNVSPTSPGDFRTDRLEQYAPATHVLPTLQANVASETNLVLQVGAIISGSVARSDGGLTEDVELSLRPYPYNNTVQTAVVTAADSTFEFVGVAPGTYRIWAEPVNPNSNLKVERLDGIVVDSETDATEISFQMERWATLSGRLTFSTPDGEIPAPNVVAQLADGLVAVTDNDGWYSFPNVNPGTYTLNFYGSWVITEYWDDAHSLESASPIVVAEEAQLTGYDAALERYGYIAGRAMFSLGGIPQPLDQAEVSFYLLNEDTGRFSFEGQATSGSDGSFVALALAPGQYAIRVRDMSGLGLNTSYYPGVRFLFDAELYEVQGTQTTMAGDIVLEGRSLVAGRLAGADRFETNAAINQFAFDEVPVVYVANGRNYPDALAAGPAAVAEGGALLLVDHSDIPDSIVDELERLNPDRIVVVGGPAAVSEPTFQELSAFAPHITRINGVDRYDTALKLVDYAFDEADGVFVATGTNFPDALAAGPAAGTAGMPVVLVDGNGGGLYEGTIDLFDELGVSELYIAGGAATVNSTVEQQLRQGIASYLGHQPPVVRYAGVDRYDTAIRINQGWFDDSEYAFLASGAGFADALSGGPAAGALGAPLYLSQPNCLGLATLVDIYDVNANGVLLLGGPAALNDSVLNGPLC